MVELPHPIPPGNNFGLFCPGIPQAKAPWPHMDLMLPIYLVAIRKLRMDTVQFSSWKRGFFRHGKKIKVLREGVHRYAAQSKSAD